MNITIIGAGNIGTAMAAVISRIGKCNLIVYTSKARQWNSTIEYEDMLTGECIESGVIDTTDDIEIAVKNADVIFITVPSFLRKTVIGKMSGKLRSGCMVVFIPGCGGMEYVCSELSELGCIVSGTDRVPCVARVVEHGKKVMLDWKKSIRLSALKASDTVRVCQIVSELLGLECKPLKNYLTVTLTPSNQIMHTVRLYHMFKYADKERVFDRNISFYGEWDDNASRLLLECDTELQSLCEKLRWLDLSEVIPLSIHYQSSTAEELTCKIHSIESLKRIESPMVECAAGAYRIDFTSRYFQEDFPYGLCIIKSLGIIVGSEMPKIDGMIRWYEALSGHNYFGDGTWNGEDLKKLNIPQNSGVCSIQDLVEFYGGKLR